MCASEPLWDSAKLIRVAKKYVYACNFVDINFLPQNLLYIIQYMGMCIIIYQM